MRAEAASPLETGETNSLFTTGGDTIQADLYFSSAAEFGQWRIFCPRAFLSNVTRDNASKAVLVRLQYVPLSLFGFLVRWTELTSAFTGSCRWAVFQKLTKSD